MTTTLVVTAITVLCAIIAAALQKTRLQDRGFPESRRRSRKTVKKTAAVGGDKHTQRAGAIRRAKPGREISSFFPARRKPLL
jgi:hypothetical protein